MEILKSIKNTFLMNLFILKMILSLPKLPKLLKVIHISMAMLVLEIAMQLN